MEIRDPIYGHIELLAEEIPLITHPLFQRLRGVKQLGLSDVAFPGATHTRFLHSIAVCHLSKIVFDQVFFKHQKILTSSQQSDLLRLKMTLSCAALLHDVGHAPLSHASEVAMPNISALHITDSRFRLSADRKASHEEYSFKIITDSSLSLSFKSLEQKFGVSNIEVASIIIGKTLNPDYFTIGGINFFPVITQLMSSELDIDRMDYLRRDSYFCGVPYGQFDWQWLMKHLSFAAIDSTAYLCLDAKAISTFEDYLLSRFHMFMMVYFHYRAVCLEQMLLNYFTGPDNQYFFPTDINDYQSHDDHYLIQQLKLSNNIWAKRIINNQIPAKIFESYFDEHQSTEIEFEQITSLLTDAKKEFIVCKSHHRLSKYQHLEPNKTFPIYIKKNILTESEDDHQHQQALMIRPLKEVTSLFEKYQHQHSLTRIHCDLDNDPKLIKKINDILSKKA